MRQVVDALSMLAYAGGDASGAAIKDNLHILLGKWLASFNPKIVRIGVVSAVAVVKNASGGKCADESMQSANTSVGDTAENSPGNRSDVAHLRTAKRLLERVYERARESGEVRCCFVAKRH